MLKFEHGNITNAFYINFNLHILKGEKKMNTERRKIFELFEKNKEFADSAVKNGIEQNRKDDAEIKLTDKNGKPIKGVKIKVNQKTHDFRFGANIFMLDELETEEKNEKYKEAFKGLFNMATLPFYWSDLEPEEGKTRYTKDSSKIYRRPTPDLCMEFCKENEIEPREHGLAYEAWFPNWLKDADVFTIKDRYEKRCKEISERYGDKIRTIEVTNEHDWEKGKTAMYEEPDLVEYSFKTARKYFGANELTINEWPWLWSEPARTRSRYYMQIERALRNGAEIDAVGMQYHMFFKSEEEYEKTRKYYDPKHLYDVLNLYSRFNKPIQITEITFPAYTDSAEDEEIQAELIRLHYSLWFAHKNVEQIIYWNLPDGYAAFAPQGDMTSGENYYRGGLLRFDLSKKPAYYMLNELINKTWRTNTEITTDENGIAKFRGFCGKYEITVENSNEKESIHVKKDCKNKKEITVK